MCALSGPNSNGSQFFITTVEVNVDTYYTLYDLYVVNALLYVSFSVSLCYVCICMICMICMHLHYIVNTDPVAGRPARGLRERNRRTRTRQEGRLFIYTYNTIHLFYVNTDIYAIYTDICYVDRVPGFRERPHLAAHRHRGLRTTQVNMHIYYGSRVYICIYTHTRKYKCMYWWGEVVEYGLVCPV